MDYPEGLHLAYTPDSELGIFDAQDVCWLIFTDGGNEDPPSWQANIIASACKALDVTDGFNEMTEVVTVDALIFEYLGVLPFGRIA